jgi:hypothetical protein
VGSTSPPVPSVLTWQSSANKDTPSVLGGHKPKTFFATTSLHPSPVATTFF